MPPSKNIRDMAAAHAAARERPELLPELPAALASGVSDGMQRGREIAARCGENLARSAAAIAFGEGTRSLHTRLQAMQLLWNMIEAVPETIPAPPDNAGPSDQVTRPEVTSLPVQRRRQARQWERVEQIDLVEQLEKLLDPGIVFWTAVDNQPWSKVAGILRRKRGCKSGIPDFLIICGGRAIFIELKSKSGTVSKVQKQRRLEILAAGASWLMARSARATLVGLHRAGVPFRRRWKPPKLQIWEGPFSSLTPPPPLAPEVQRERREAKQRWRARQRERRAATAHYEVAQKPDGPALEAARKTAG